MMKTRWFLVVALVLIGSLPAWALFCSECGQKLKDGARFCSKCGVKTEGSSPGKGAPPDPAGKKPDPAPVVTPKAAEVATGGTFKTKTDLFAYPKRGDEHNVLKKNFLFKPRRFRIPPGAEIRILETVGDTLQIEWLSGDPAKNQKGWVTQEELALRSTWTK